MNNNFISTKKTYIAPTAKFIIVEMQHLMAGSTSGAGTDTTSGGSNPTPGTSAKDGIFFIDDTDFMNYE